jgi:hypothetical protein
MGGFVGRATGAMSEKVNDAVGLVPSKRVPSPVALPPSLPVAS